MSSSERRPVLIIEDELAAVHSLRRLVSSWGYLVNAVGGAQEALSVCRSERPCFVIVNFTTPEMDGLELALRLREAYGEQSPPLAVLTADVKRRDSRGYPSAISVLLKPVPAAFLRELVDKTCAEHRRPPYIVPDSGSMPPEVA